MTFTDGAGLEDLMNRNCVTGSAFRHPSIPYALVVRVAPDCLALAIELIRRTKPGGLHVEFQTLGPLEICCTKDFIFIHA